MIEINDKLLEFCERYYDKDTMEHAKRVYYYAQDSMWDAIERSIGGLVALCHDLLEDTSCTVKDLSKLCSDPDFVIAVKILTKNKGEKYVAYCKRIKQASLECLAGRIAWFVKLADIKDHLSQRDTLTDRLKEKYLAGLAELL